MTDPAGGQRPPRYTPQPPTHQRVAATSPANPSDPRLTLEAGRFWAGAAATAIVAALVGLIGVIVFERVFEMTLVPPPDVFSTGSHQSAFALDGAVLAILAAGVLHLLIVAAPRPRSFFGWIMALVIVVIAVLPFAWTTDTLAAALSGVVNLLIGVAVWSLLSGVAARTIIPAR